MYGILPLFPTFLHLELAVPTSGYSLLASLPSSRVDTGGLQGSRVLLSGCGWPALPLEDGHPLLDHTLPRKGSFLCWSASEPCKVSSVSDAHTWRRFRGNIRNFLFFRSLEVSQRSSRVYWQQLGISTKCLVTAWRAVKQQGRQCT